MATRKPLRAVTSDDKPEKAPPKTLAEAAEDGSYLEILVAQRREMIRDVKEVSGPAKAAMHRQIALHSKEIAALKAAAEQEANEDADTADDEPFDSEAL